MTTTPDLTPTNARGVQNHYAPSTDIKGDAAWYGGASSGYHGAAKRTAHQLRELADLITETAIDPPKRGTRVETAARVVEQVQQTFNNLQLARLIEAAAQMDAAAGMIVAARKAADS